MPRKLPKTDADGTHNAIRPMVVAKEDRGYDFQADWIRQREWYVVPVEDSGHFGDEEIRRIVQALKAAGCTSLFAIGAPDLPTDFANVYELSVSGEDFEAFNAEFGVLRVLLTDPALSWAISCNEWFNLLAGPESLIEQMLGGPIDGARRDFLEYAEMVEQGGTEGLVRVARQYS